jgi:predicted tellurium resistance membrane protein TerC
MFRIGLLLSIAWIANLTAPWFYVAEHGISGRDVILFGGGLFLLAKATREIHHRVEGLDELEEHSRKPASYRSVIAQIILLDLVFSLDSVITAVGLSQHLGVMINANVAAMAVMVVSSGAIANFLNRHPSLVMLALAFLILVGFVLVLDGMGIEVNRGYVYTAMAFSVSVEFLNMRRQEKLRRRREHTATSVQEPAS